MWLKVALGIVAMYFGLTVGRLESAAKDPTPTRAIAYGAILIAIAVVVGAIVMADPKLLM